MVLPRQIPQWVIDDLEEVIIGYQDSLPLLYSRCQTLARSGRVNGAGIPFDEKGTLSHYLMDAKYCAGQTVRMTLTLREMIPPAQWESHPLAQLPTRARDLAPWAWDHPWKDCLVVVMSEVNILQWKDFFLRFTEKERRALVYTIGLKMKYREAAAKMGISVSRLKKIVLNARKRFGPNVPDFTVVRPS